MTETEYVRIEARLRKDSEAEKLYQCFLRDAEEYGDKSKMIRRAIRLYLHLLYNPEDRTRPAQYVMPIGFFDLQLLTKEAEDSDAE